MPLQRSSKRATKRARAPKRRIEIRFEKTPGFRTIHIDGAFGGVTTTRGIAVSLYHETRAVPDGITLEIGGRGTTEVARQGEQAYLREIEVQAMMTPVVARSIASWLIERANEAEQATEETGSSGTSGETA